MKSISAEIADLVGSGRLLAKDVVCGSSFPPAPGSLCGKVRGAAIKKGEFVVQAILPSSEIMEVTIPMEHLGLNVAPNIITVYNAFAPGGHVLTFGL